jgi:hypothetical protein
LKISLNPLRYERREHGMRKFILPVFIAAGALIGLFSAAQDGWGTRMVMMGMGVMFAAPVGAVLAGRFGRHRKAVDWPMTSAPGDVTSPKALTENYWRDKGHPPFMKPSDSPPDRHQFDPERLP